MLDFSDFLINNPAFRRFEVDELLFAAYDCPLEGSPIDYWVDRNYFCYVIHGGALWKTPTGEYTLKVGDGAFLKKGAHRVFKILTGEFCALLMFAPDNFIGSVVREDIGLRQMNTNVGQADSVVPLELNQTHHTYFSSVLDYFSLDTPPSKSLLKLKFKELIIQLTSTTGNPVLTNFFIELASGKRKALEPIMQEHFVFNLKLADFAKLSGRSLATFKRDFEKTFHTSPGKWLKNKRLNYSKFLLETTTLNINEIALESGFENTSHFIRVFKERYDCSPLKLRKSLLTASTTL